MMAMEGASGPSIEGITVNGGQWDLERVRLHEAEHVMAPEPSHQHITFQGGCGRWDSVGVRLNAAQERHSFLATRSLDSSPEFYLHHEEKNNWNVVSQTVRFAPHFANRRSSRRGSSAIIVSPERRMLQGSITSRQGSITIADEERSKRRSSITAGGITKDSVRHESDKVRRSHCNAATRALSNAPTAAAATSRKQAWQGGLPVAEDSTALKVPRWKLAWLRRKHDMEQGGALPGNRSGNASERSQPRLSQTPRSTPGSLKSVNRQTTGLGCTRACSEPGLGLTSYYKFIKAKYPDVAACASRASSTSSTPTIARASSSSSTPTPTATRADASEQGEPRLSWARLSAFPTPQTGDALSDGRAAVTRAPVRNGPQTGTERALPRRRPPTLSATRSVPSGANLLGAAPQGSHRGAPRRSLSPSPVVRDSSLEEREHWAMVSQQATTRKDRLASAGGTSGGPPLVVRSSRPAYVVVK
ncbi:hypothetical protein T484DRAFT_1905557 [Baffinella frigidus]|nr:hypothetical protein T484DRAFT_1905557 [Cryptophyta sp. CCMP2293]